MIEKIIWQTHEWEYPDLPEHLRAVTMAWKNLNPGWDYRYVDAKERAAQVEQFDSTLYKFYLLADKVTQADLWRYIAVYKNGGVYADMDSYCTSPLDYTIEKNYDGKEVFATAPTSNYKYESNNANFAATMNSEIMKTIIETIYERYKNIKLYNALVINGGNLEFSEALKASLRTGPEDYSNVVMENKDKVCFGFVGVIHGEDFKHKFYPDYAVDYYGDMKSYSMLVEENSWSLL